jgi:hypothetical protein
MVFSLQNKQRKAGAVRCEGIVFKLCFIYCFTGLFKRMLGKKQGRRTGIRAGSFFPKGIALSLMEIIV